MFSIFSLFKKEVPIQPEVPQKKISPSLITPIIDQFMSDLTNQLRQELIGVNESTFERPIKSCQGQLARISWQSAQHWVKWENDGPVLMPDNTRLYYRKGNTEIVLQEFHPQTRFMRFNSHIAREVDTIDDKVYSYSLALPYLVFIHRFVEGIFLDCYVSFNDRPLKTLEEVPLTPYLSNIDDSLKLCHGKSFDRTMLQPNNIVQQIAYIMSLFWSTVYTNEWANNYWTSKYGFQDDNRLNSLEAWQEATTDDPLFVIDNVKWKTHTYRSYGYLINGLLEKDQINLSLQQEIHQKFIEKLTDQIESVVKENVCKLTRSIDVKKYADLIIAEINKQGC